MQIKTIMRYHFTSVRMSKIKKSGNDVGKDVEKEEPSYAVAKNASWCSHSKTVWRFLKKLKTELPYISAIALLGIYSKDTNVGI